MKYIILSLLFFGLLTGTTYAQTHELHGTVADTTKATIPGSTVKLLSDAGDSTVTVTDIDGKFHFANIKGVKITLAVTSIGYEGIRKRYTLDVNDSKPITLDPIVLKTEARQLNQVNIVGVIPVKIKEDTVDYKISAYKVRENAPVEDVLKKIPGVDVDAAGNVTTQGKSITKVRINGKDFMAGDVQAATKNFPADLLESVQVIDDYGDQANLTGIRTGEPNKILNFTIRADKNYGYSLQASAGDGSDLLPEENGVKPDNRNRYAGSVNYFNFKGNRQVTVLGAMNNTNTNTFNFGGGGGGGNRGGGRQGGGAGNNSLASNRDGITLARAIGANYRDQWGQFTSVYGSYSFSDNSTSITSNTLRTNTGQNSRNTNQATSTENPVNHRFNFNLEYKPDTINYLKIQPSFSYSKNYSTSIEDVLFLKNNTTINQYRTDLNSNSQSPNGRLEVLYNHRFPGRRNLSVFVNGSTAQTLSYSNPIVNYTVGSPNVPLHQVINTENRTTSYGGNFSYLEPLGKISYLELSYSFNRSETSNDKQTDTLYAGGNSGFLNDKRLSNNYTFNFTTHRVGLGYRVVAEKYNYTLGLGIQPSVLDGHSITNNTFTRKEQTNFIPAARFIYNFSRNESLSINYRGSAEQPTFNQLQPVVDLSSAAYPVQGNPDLQQQFTNNIFVRYNTFGIASGNIMFLNASFTKIDNYVATRTTTYGNLSPAALAADPQLSNFRNTILTRYRNTDGYYQASGGVFFSKPWAERKYTVSANMNFGYTQAPGFVDSVSYDNVQSESLKNLAKIVTLNPGVRFRLDLQDIVDVQAGVNYSINKTTNTLLGTSAFGQNTDIRALNLGLNGKNYFGDWTFSYDYNKQFNYGYSIAVKNPNILSVYLERRFLAQKRATIRLAAIDLFNQNTGFSQTSDGNSITQSNVNRLGRYFMATISFRLQKFAGRNPMQDGERGGPGGNREGGPRREGGGGGNWGGGGNRGGGGPGGF